MDWQLLLLCNTHDFRIRICMLCLDWVASRLPCPRGSSWVGSDLTWHGVEWWGCWGLSYSNLAAFEVFQAFHILPTFWLIIFVPSLSLCEGGNHSQGERGEGCQFRYIVSYCSLSCVLVLVAWSLMCHHRHALKLHSYCGRYEQDTRNWTRASPYSPHTSLSSITPSLAQKLLRKLPQIAGTSCPPPFVIPRWTRTNTRN